MTWVLTLAFETHGAFLLFNWPATKPIRDLESFAAIHAPGSRLHQINDVREEGQLRSSVLGDELDDAQNSKRQDVTNFVLVRVSPAQLPTAVTTLGSRKHLPYAFAR